jgi:hypothetical protein
MSGRQSGPIPDGRISKSLGVAVAGRSSPWRGCAARWPRQPFAEIVRFELSYCRRREYDQASFLVAKMNMAQKSPPVDLPGGLSVGSGSSHKRQGNGFAGSARCRPGQLDEGAGDVAGLLR